MHAYLDTPGLEYGPCPHEPKNFMLKSAIPNHLKSCPKLLETNTMKAQEFYSKGINFFLQDGEQAEEEKVEAVHPDKWQSVIEEAYDRLKLTYGSEKAFAELFDVDAQMDMWTKLNEQEGRAHKLLTEGMKHGNQQTNIVNKMHEEKLLEAMGDEEIIYVEYGAGKAGLSSFVAMKLE